LLFIEKKSKTLINNSHSNSDGGEEVGAEKRKNAAYLLKKKDEKILPCLYNYNFKSLFKYKNIKSIDYNTKWPNFSASKLLSSESSFN
jgi:hypothetical protein